MSPVSAGRLTWMLLRRDQCLVRKGLASEDSAYTSVLLYMLYDGIVSKLLPRRDWRTMLPIIK